MTLLGGMHWTCICNLPAQDWAPQKDAGPYSDDLTLRRSGLLSCLCHWLAKERTVVFVADLREVSDCGRRVRDKLEAVLCRRCKRGHRGRRPYRHLNGSGGVFDVIPSEPGRSVAERHPPFNAVPVNAERFEDSTHKSQCVSGVEAVRNTKGVEDGAEVLDVKNGLAAVQVDFHVAVRELDRPHD